MRRLKFSLAPLIADIGPDDKPVHDDLDGVLFVLLQLDLLVQFVEAAVHSGPDIAGALGILKHTIRCSPAQSI